MLLFALITFFFVDTEGHARLTSPHPWGVEESVSTPCGGEVLVGHSASAVWISGQKASIGWFIASDDGFGQVTLSISSTGNISNFQTNSSTVWKTTLPNTTNSVGNFAFNITAPNLTCTGPGNVCVLQAHATSGWVDCATIQILPSGSPHTINMSTSCALAFSNLCPIDGVDVLLQGDTTLADLDDNVQQNLDLLTDKTIFSSGTTKSCNDAFMAYICGSTFLPCTKPNSCYSTCTQMNCICGVTQEHATAYPCSSAMLMTGNDTFGACDHQYAAPGSTCASQSHAGHHLHSAFLLLLLITILNFLV